MKFFVVGGNSIDTEESRASGMAPRFDPITGIPEATASIETRPKPSGYWEAIKNTEA